MKVFNVHEAKTNLSKLLELVEEGQEVLIARNGTPVARLVRHRVPVRKPGRLAGRIVVHDSFDDPLPEEMLSAFRGEGP
jgi:prevent-host-death family protein